MSDFKRCPHCGDHGWFGNKVFPDHKCAPVWECRPQWNASDDEAWDEIHASDAESAAEKYAERYDHNSGDYPIVSGMMRNDVIIQVRRLGDDEFESWEVYGEAVPTYRATKIEAPALTSQPRGSQE